MKRPGQEYFEAMTKAFREQPVVANYADPVALWPRRLQERWPCACRELTRLS